MVLRSGPYGLQHLQGRIAGVDTMEQFLVLWLEHSLIFARVWVSQEQWDVNLPCAAAVHQGARQLRHVHSTLKDELLLLLMLAPCCRVIVVPVGPLVLWSVCEIVSAFLMSCFDDVLRRSAQ
ncbi:uncharacterized protein LOC119329324 isoform X2 [Triticum dicoccoides]|nr:uncharacterized protein LOC119329324 isoform X2 [Triticum dicoccoides]XP_044392786.1 uncharacterized protein LOC123115748 isoform X2 [Triticum aestivum]